MKYLALLIIVFIFCSFSKEKKVTIWYDNNVSYPYIRELSICSHGHIDIDTIRNPHVSISFYYDSLESMEIIPGDTIMLRDTVSNFTLFNIRGTSSKPIVITGDTVSNAKPALINNFVVSGEYIKITGKNRNFNQGYGLQFRAIKYKEGLTYTTLNKFYCDNLYVEYCKFKTF